MLNFLKFFLLLLTIFLTSCSSDKKKVSVIQNVNLEDQMIESYKKGFEELERGDVIYAAKQFNEAELLYPQSEWAPKSILMAAYAFTHKIITKDLFLN